MVMTRKHKNEFKDGKKIDRKEKLIKKCNVISAYCLFVFCVFERLNNSKNREY